MRLELILEGAKRVVIAATLYTPFFTALNSALTTLQLTTIGLEGLVVLSTNMLIAFSTVLALLTGNIFAYLIPLIASTMFLGLNYFQVTVLVFFTMYLVLDTLTMVLRGGEVKYLRYSIKTWMRAILTPLIIVIPVFIVAYFTTHTLVLLFTNTTIQQSSLNPSILIILASPITKIVLVLACVVYVYLTVERFAEIFTGFIKPSYSISINKLLETKDIDVFYTPLSNWILYVSIAFLFYPVLYTMIFDILLVDVREYIVTHTPEYFSKYIVPFLFFILLALLARYLHTTIDPLEAPKRLMYASLTLMLLIYASSIKLVYPEKGWLGVIQPGFQELSVFLEEKFVDYGYEVISILDLLSRILGVAP